MWVGVCYTLLLLLAGHDHLEKTYHSFFSFLWLVVLVWVGGCYTLLLLLAGLKLSSFLLLFFAAVEEQAMLRHSRPLKAPPSGVALGREALTWDVSLPQDLWRQNTKT